MNSLLKVSPTTDNCSPYLQPTAASKQEINFMGDLACHDCACKMIKSCFLQCHKVAKKLPKIQNFATLISKCCCLQFHDIFIEMLLNLYFLSFSLIAN